MVIKTLNDTAAAEVAKPAVGYLRRRNPDFLCWGKASAVGALYLERRETNP
jgi:hypothetical protein